MFFFLSKTVSYLAMPLTIIVILFVAAGLLKSIRLKKILFWIALSMLFIFSNDFFVNEALLAWEVKATPYQDIKPHKVGIVLTGVTRANMKPDDRVYYQRGADRLVHTVQLYKLGLIKTILISGGSGRIGEVDEPEANKCKKALVLMGVDSTAILLENITRNTHESAVKVKGILDSLGVSADDCLLITSAFHMRRSLACYKKVGLGITPFSTDFYSHQDVYQLDSFIVPKVEALFAWNKLVKEWIGLAAYTVAGYV